MIKKFAFMILSLFLMTFVVFIITDAIPGSFYHSGIFSGIPKEKIEAKKNIENQDLNTVNKYLNWMSGVLKGDLGVSVLYKKPVTRILRQRLKYSFYLSLFALIIEIVMGYLISLFVMVISKKGKVSGINNVIMIVLLSLPVFFVGALLKKWFALQLDFFPISGFRTVGLNLSGIKEIGDVLNHLLLPAFTLAIVSIGSFVKFITGALEEELNKDYIRYAKSRGLSNYTIIKKHAMRNIRLPVLSYIVTNIPLLFGGAIIVEQLFDINGLGKLAFDAALGRDFPLLLGYTLFFSVITFLTNFCADFIYKTVDPRIKEL